jgi:hypothetical protein
VVSPAGRVHFARRSAHASALLILCLATLTGSAAALAASFVPQTRLGYRTGDQWEPAIAADTHGHVYVLYPQYGPVADCTSCSVPVMTLLISNDNGASWQASRTILPFSTGQFDPQIAVDPVDHQTVYASWLQDRRRDVIVARSLDFGRNWSFALAQRGRDDFDKPVLAVHGADVYVGFNHDEEFLVAASHDAGQTFSVVGVNPNAAPGSSLAGGATVDPAGVIYFGWTAYARHEVQTQAVGIYVSRSSDGGRTWSTVLLDVSASPPECASLACEPGFLGAQIALASDSAGGLYALWNAGSESEGPERIYFSASTTGGASWSARANVSTAGSRVEHAFPAIIGGVAGDVRIAWMDSRESDGGRVSRPLWNTYYRSSTNGGATWSAETQLSSAVRGYDYILPAGFRFPFGDYFSLAIDGDGATHAVWGQGRNYKSPGTIWYSRGR